MTKKCQRRPASRAGEVRSMPAAVLIEILPECGLRRLQDGLCVLRNGQGSPTIAEHVFGHDLFIRWEGLQRCAGTLQDRRAARLRHLQCSARTQVEQVGRERRAVKCHAADIAHSSRRHPFRRVEPGDDRRPRKIPADRTPCGLKVACQDKKSEKSHDDATPVADEPVDTHASGGDVHKSARPCCMDHEVLPVRQPAVGSYGDATIHILRCRHGGDAPNCILQRGASPHKGAPGSGGRRDDDNSLGHGSIPGARRIPGEICPGCVRHHEPVCDERQVQCMKAGRNVVTDVQHQPAW